MTNRPYTEVPYVAPDGERVEASGYDATSEEKHAVPRQWYLGSDMGKRILGIVIVVLVVVVLYYAYQRHVANLAESGAVRTDDTSVKAVPDTTVAQADVDNSVKPRKSSTMTDTPLVPTNAPATVVAPATDSIAANPANGMIFSGTGKFQVYRQGNLTWRVDTDGGNTCVLFATMEEWSKPIVYQHACN